MAMVRCRECAKDVSTTADKCPHCGSPVPHRAATGRAVIGGLFALGFLGWLFGGGPEHQAAASMKDIHQQVANDMVQQYEIAKRSGDAMQTCVQAGLVAAGYLQGKDEAAFNRWKAIEGEDCKRAGLR
jgi:hypothetical protein